MDIRYCLGCVTVIYHLTNFILQRSSDSFLIGKFFWEMRGFLAVCVRTRADRHVGQAQKGLLLPGEAEAI